MLKRILTFNWMPHWARQNHPVVWYYLRQPKSGGVNTVIFGSTVLLFLLFGGLSLPLLYFLFSLISLMQIAIITSNKLHSARTSGYWDVLTLTNLSQSEIMLAMWSAGVRHQNKTLTIPLYRILQGFAVISAMIYGLWFGEIHIQNWLLLLLWGTCIIALQPLAEMYLGGMLGLLLTSVIRDQITSLGLLIFSLLITWLAWLSITLWLLFNNMNQVSFLKLVLALGIPLIVPLFLGYLSFQLAKRANH